MTTAVETRATVGGSDLGWGWGGSHARRAVWWLSVPGRCATGRARTTASCAVPKGRVPPGTHQLLLALNDGQRRLVGVAVLPARVPVSRLLREEVALPSVEQPVLRAGGFALDAALGSCGEGGGVQLRPQPWPLPRPPALAPPGPPGSPARLPAAPSPCLSPWFSWCM